MVRKVNSIEKYKQIIKVIPFTTIESERLKFLCNIVDHFLYYNNIEIIGFDTIKASKLHWHLIKTNNLYENGLPHTRKIEKNIVLIVLPERILELSNYILMKTLLHEKIHVYQKIYEKDTKIFINNLHFSLVGNKDNFNEKIRSNPDTDSNIYKKNNKLYMTIYNDTLKNVSDTTTYPINNVKLEHPYEIMAYKLEDLLIF